MERLRRAGLQVSSRGDKLVLRGQPLAPELVALARRHKAELLADLEEDAVVHETFKCPGCGILDYEPLGNGRRRCYGCGHVWVRK